MERNEFLKTNSSNIVLIAIGLALIALGLFRQTPIKFNKTFMWNSVPMTAMLVLVIALAWKYNRVLISDKDVRTIIERGVDGTMGMASSFFITIILLMPMIGLSTVLTPVFEKQVIGLLESKLGWILVWPLAFISAGGSGFSGVVIAIWRTANHLKPLLLYFLTVTPLTAFTIFQIRRLGIGDEIAGEMYKLNWAAAIWLMPFFWCYGKLFCR